MRNYWILVNVDYCFIKELFYCKEDQLYTTAALTNGKVNFLTVIMLKFMMAMILCLMIV